MGANCCSADGEAKATLELVLSVIQEGPEGQRQGQGRELLLQRGAHDPVAIHRAYGQTAVVRAMCQPPTLSPWKHTPGRLRHYQSDCWL